MITISPDELDLFLLEDAVWILTAPVDVPSYDFSFDTFFACRRPWQRPDFVTAIGRFGVTTDYAGLYQELQAKGIRLIHSPEQYLLTSELPNWYPLLEDLTPKSLWFDTPPLAAEIEQSLSWPVFLKGSRQTSRHKSELAIIRSAAEYDRAVAHYQRDPVLHWQRFVCREYVDLRPVPAPPSDRIPPSFEFRTFWWRGQLVGAGPYWSAFASYTWTREEEHQALTVAQEAARRINAPFLVVDVAQTKAGAWIVIECNDGQESGYVGLSPLGLWQRLIDIERVAE